jgi:hypothetical protein
MNVFRPTLWGMEQGDNMTAIIVRLDRFLPEEKSSSSEIAPASHSVKRPLTEDSLTDVAQPESDGNY